MRITKLTDNKYANAPAFNGAVRVKILDKSLKTPEVAPHHIVYKMTILKGMLELYEIPFKAIGKRILRFGDELNEVVAGIIADLNRSRNPQSVYRLVPTCNNK